jgi:pSer/pThr/pTyr-binding forkhead associated (FHA) protein
MKVQLVVVRGKPEGKVIPLFGPSFKIGRGETCHLRPNSEQVSREHAEFTINGNTVSVRDLGSRNGTLVNGSVLKGAACRLKDRDLVQVGPLTFAVTILDPTATAVHPVAVPTAPTPASRSDDISGDDIDAWLVGPSNAPTVEQPTPVYGGDTVAIAAFTATKPAAPPSPVSKAQPPTVSDDEYNRQADDDPEENSEEPLDESDELDEAIAEDESEAGDEAPEEFLDASNPFYAAKKAQKEQGKQIQTAKPSYKDTSDAAGDILRRLMERRRAEKAS